MWKRATPWKARTPSSEPSRKQKAPRVLRRRDAVDEGVRRFIGSDLLQSDDGPQASPLGRAARVRQALLDDVR